MNVWECYTLNVVSCFPEPEKIRIVGCPLPCTLTSFLSSRRTAIGPPYGAEATTKLRMLISWFQAMEYISYLLEINVNVGFMGLEKVYTNFYRKYESRPSINQSAVSIAADMVLYLFNKLIIVKFIVYFWGWQWHWQLSSSNMCYIWTTE